MAEDESRTNTSHSELGSSSKEEKDELWLQLGIGLGSTSHQYKNITTISSDLITTGNNSSALTDLQLLPPGTSSSSFSNWVPFGPVSTCSSSSSYLMPLLGSSSSYFASRQFQIQMGSDIINPGSSLDFRVVKPPRRPQSGIWFTLRASQNQTKEQFLPQISKSYLRIRDGKMTVRLLMKFLGNKLRLGNESEIEITCRGQELQPCLTLQHVRDNIWSPREAMMTTSLPSESITDHVMVLNYSRRP